MFDLEFGQFLLHLIHSIPGCIGFKFVQIKGYSLSQKEQKSQEHD